MKVLIKGFLILAAAAVVIAVAAVVIIPKVVDVESYRPVIETKVSEALGRPFRLAGDLDVSVFPWLGIKFSDLSVGNPDGYTEKNFAAIKTFEARIKVIPLLSKDIQVSRFVMDGPELVLVKKKNGSVNWEGLGGAGKAGDESKTSSTTPGTDTVLPITSLMVDEFAITNGRILFRDEAAGLEKQVTGVNLVLQGISLDKPIQIDLSAIADGRDISLAGTLGPLGKDPAKSTIPVDITATLLKKVSINLKGNVIEPVGRQSMDFQVAVAEFSPRTLSAALGMAFPVETRDPAALSRMAFKTRIKAGPEAVDLTEGSLTLDDTTLTFTAGVKAFSKPDIAFDLNLDSMDLDRYLPPASQEGEPVKAAPSSPAQSPQSKPVDYDPLRRLVLNGKVAAGSLKAHGATVTNVILKITGNKGVFTVDPFSVDLYQGSAAADATVDLRKDSPVTSMKLKADSIQSGPLLKDLQNLEIIEGSMNADVSLNLSGDTPDAIKKSLGGKGELVFRDGAVVGVDLAGMVRNTAASFGLTKKAQERPKTDFAELKAPFTISQGVLTTSGTSLVSPLIRVVVAGTADLVKEALDLRVEPKVVATLVGQGDTKERQGIKVPVLITGTFTEPKFRPDLAGILTNQAGDVEALKALAGDKAQRKEALKSLEKDFKSMLNESTGQDAGAGAEKASGASGDAASESPKTDPAQEALKSLFKGFGKSKTTN